MKKLAFLGSSIFSLISPLSVWAADDNKIIIETPKKGFATLGDAISKTLTFAFLAAIILVLVMLVIGAFEWIASGGDKEAVAKARTRILNALIGLAVLAVAFALAKVAGQFLGFDFNNITIPTPNPSPPGS